MEVVTLSNGGVGVRFPSMTIAVVIPSRKREAMLARCPLLPIANVFVHADEEESYAEYFAEHELAFGTLNTHRAVGGISRIRNAMMNAMWPEDVDCVFQSDDDTSAMKWMGGRVTYYIRDVTHFMEIVAGTAYTAREMGAAMFGYHQSGRPNERQAQKPFTLRSWISTQGAGFLDRSMRFDERTSTHDDMDFSLQAIAKHGYVLRDNRWFVEFNGASHAREAGGAASLRSIEREREEYAYLQAKWGADVICEGVQRGAGITISVSIPK